MFNAINRILTGPTPQNRPIPGREADMAGNNAGGFAFTLDRWARLDRFLVLGTSGGTFYVTERDLTVDNLAVVAECLDADGVRTVGRIVEVSERGLAPRNTPALFALAAACSAPDEATRAAANAAIRRVCRTGTHLFQFAAFVKALREGGAGRGWGRGLRRGVARVFEEMPVDRLALHGVKYRQRNGWTHRDLLRLSHPGTGASDNAARRAVYDFLCGRGLGDDAPDILRGFDAITGDDGDEGRAARLVAEHRLPWEAVPDRFRGSVAVQRALLDQMPVTATVRQLATFARLDMLTPLGNVERTIVDRLTDRKAIRRSRAHPLQFLDAHAVHASGGRVGRSKGAPYRPNQAVLNALERAFHLAFANVKPTKRRTYLALDVSGSMGWGPCAGSVAVTPRLGSMAMALVTAAVEPRHHLAAFSTSMVDLRFPGRPTLGQALQVTDQLPFGGTDCAQPMLDALSRRIEVDTFVVYTDSETWAGSTHPVEALRRYRNQMGIDARLVVVGMTSTGFSIADPSDPGMMDVVGFSSETPSVISAFSRRSI